MRRMKLVGAALVVVALPAAQSFADPVFKTLYSFRNFLHSPEDASLPFADLALDTGGRLYGTAEADGSGGSGAVFRLTPPANGQTAWTEKLLYSFGGRSTSIPLAGVAIDRSGNVYGTTTSNHVGRPDTGVVYKLDRANGYAFTVLHRFDLVRPRNGLDPEASLIFGPGGLLYGTTMDGGPGNNGTIFSVAPAGGAKSFSVIASFPGERTDGRKPNFGALSVTPQGDLLASTMDVPANTVVLRRDQTPGHVFLLRQTNGIWQEQIVNRFPKRNGFYYPTYNVTQTADGTLYGCAKGGKYGLGGVFGLVPPGNGGPWPQIPVYSFTGDAGQPLYQGNSICALTSDTSGNLFGITGEGGQNGTGVFFELTPAAGHAGWSETTLYQFGPNDLPWGVPLRIGHAFYGVSATGGDDGVGYVYELTP